jgi:uncharacterized protein (TIRG00374 family)
VSPKVRALIGILISAAVLWWLVAKSGIDWKAAWVYMKDASKPLLVLATIVANVMFPLRARRWRPILAAVKPHIPFGPLWRSTAIGMMANTLLPFRMGEVARALALTREEPDVPISASVASLFVDRIFDALVVVLLLVVALFLPDVPPDARIGGKSITSLALFPAAGAVGGLVALYALAVYPAPAIRISVAVADRFGERFATTVEHIVRKFTDGLGALRTPRRFGEVFFWTVLHWLAQPLSFWIGFKAFGIQAPFAAALIAQFTIVVAVALPSVPGYVGLYELGAAAALLLFGVENSRAVAWAVTLHAVTLVPITLIGLFYLNRVGLRMSDLRDQQVNAIRE